MIQRRVEFVGPKPRLALTVAGQGPVVVFLHGIGGNRTNWDEQIEAFAPRFTAVAWDARGYGDSDDYDGPLDFADFSADLLRVLDHLEAPKAHLVGLSMGGRIAQDFYRRHPGRVASLTLADTHRGFGDLTPAQRDDYLRVRREPLLTGRTTRDIAGLLVERLVGRRANAAVHRRLTESVAALRVPSYLKSLEATVNQDRIGELGDIHVPVHFIVGEDDRLTTPTLMRAMAAEVPGAHFTLIEGAGHLTNIEAPEEFNRAVLGFLLEITPR